jgi:hypothetical protein
VEGAGGPVDHHQLHVVGAVLQDEVKGSVVVATPDDVHVFFTQTQAAASPQCMWTVVSASPRTC